MKYTIFFIFLFIGVMTNAQVDTLKVSVSEIFKDEKYKTSLLFAKEDSNGDIFTVRNYYSRIPNPKGYYIEHYSKDLKLLNRTSVEVNHDEIKGLFLTEDSVVLLQFQYNYKEKKYAFVTLTSSKDDFNFTEKEIYSLDRNRLDKYDHFGIRSEPEFNLYHNNNIGDIVESQNGEFIALNLFTKTENGDKLLVIVFNNTFEKLYEHEFENIITLKETENKKFPLEYQNMVLDNEGTVYFLGRVYNTNDKDLEKKYAPNYYFMLFKGNTTSKNQTVIPIESNKIIRSLQLATKGDKLAAVGLYTESLGSSFNFFFNTGVRYDGAVLFNLDKTSLSKRKESFQPFSEEFMLEKYGKVKENIKSYLSYRNIFMLENGDVILNVEEFEIHITDDQGNSKNIYKDIMGFRLSNDGDLTWAKNINKKQNTLDLESISFLSYASTVKNNVAYYFVNAASELKILNNNEIELRQGSRLYNLKVYEAGEFRYDKVLYPHIFNAQLAVRFGILINESDILMQAESNDKPMLVKLYF